MIGKNLGPYEIVEKLGEGGMGEVYRARDSRIGRDVAIKISAEQFSERTEREARAAAALNHPNVCTLYDVGPNYLVMELVEGEPPKGPLPLQTALEYARQIADALDAAHEKGIVHRDLKPANIKVRSDGTVKVLDFGLAKIVSAEHGDSVAANRSSSPTMPLGATQVGMILGTAAYMAPEQARGKSVDKRADIWAFGVVLYEMVTGRRAFDGDDVSSILAAVIQSEPRWDGVPPKVRRLLESCLEKDPKKRVRDIGDVWKLLDDRPSAAAGASSAGRLGWIAAGVLALVTAIAVWAPWRRESPPPLREPMRFEIDAGPDVILPPLASPTISTVVISPDGTRLVYVGSVRGGPSKLLTRTLDQSAFTELVGTEGATNPIFSRDGSWIVFWSSGALWRIAAEGGGKTKLADLSAMTGADWTDAGDLIVGSDVIAGTDTPTGLLRISSTGVRSPLLDMGKDEWFHTHPRVLPGGKHVLMEVVTREQGSYTIDVASLEDGQRRTVVRGGGSPRYLESGHLLYTNRSTLYAVPFDVERLEALGAPARMLDDVAFDTVASSAQYDVSRTGTLVYRRYSGDRSATTVQWVDPSGKSMPILERPGAYDTPRLSPDGRRFVVTVRDGVNYGVWIYEPARDAMTRLSPVGSNRVGNPVWTPDGQSVIFATMGNGISWARADGAGPPQPLLATKGIQLPTDVTRDGTRLAYFQPDGKPQIWTVPLSRDGDGWKAGTPSRFLTTASVDVDATFSPDGRWLAYASDESGRLEIYVRTIAADGTAGSRRWVTSNNAGTSPRWSPDGRDVLYLAGSEIMAAAYAVKGESFEAEKPRVWVSGVHTTGGFDLSPDGKRAAVSVPTSTAPAGAQQSFVFIVNFFDELRRRVPVAQ